MYKRNNLDGFINLNTERVSTEIGRGSYLEFAGDINAELREAR